MSSTKIQFTEDERKGLYRAIYERRDVRSQFIPDEIPPDVLVRILHAAHQAPSVGFMQPWDFIIIDDDTIKRQVKNMFDRENERASKNYSGERAKLYSKLKLEGILESPINLCVTTDRSRGGAHVLGRNSIIEMDLFSSCLAVQNLWLAARAEGIGIGWVSILDQNKLAGILNLPDNVYPIAYLCVGYVSEFLNAPELETHGWRERLPLEQLVHSNTWNTPVNDESFLSTLK